MRISIDVRPEDIAIFRKASRVRVGEDFGLKDTTTYRVALSRLVVDVMEAVDKAEGGGRSRQSQRAQVDPGSRPPSPHNNHHG